MAIIFSPKDGSDGSGKDRNRKGAVQHKAERQGALSKPDAALPVLGTGGAPIRAKRRPAPAASTHVLERKVPGSDIQLPSMARKRGRPYIEDAANTLTAQKPWLAMNMSRSTWYRREAERRKREIR